MIWDQEMVKVKAIQSLEQTYLYSLFGPSAVNSRIGPIGIFSFTAEKPDQPVSWLYRGGPGMI